eukprot:347565-Chlamydomonas_euryale.AAC.1
MRHSQAGLKDTLGWSEAWLCWPPFRSGRKVHAPHTRHAHLPMVELTPNGWTCASRSVEKMLRN